MKWYEISIDCEATLADRISEFLVDFTGRGIVIEDVDTGPPQGASLSRIRGYLPAGDEGNPAKMLSLYDCMTKEQISLDPASLSVRTIEEEDWANRWKAFFKPLRLTQRIVVKPSWTDFAASDGDIVLEIDPGMAFGTGSHPTTSLCARAMESTLSSPIFRDRLSQVKVLDVGTGTGILAMAAATLGAVHVLGIDIDEEAVAAARENVQRNALADRILVSDTALAAVQGRFSIILANLIYQGLVDICPLLGQLLDDGGVLIASGILSDQVEGLLGIYAREGFNHVSTFTEAEWSCIVLTRTAASP